MEKIGSSTFAELLNRRKSITFEQFSKLAEPLQIPDKWRDFCLRRLAHKKNNISYSKGYMDCLENHTTDLQKLILDLHDAGKAEKGQILETISVLFDCLGFTIMDLPPSWMNQECCNNQAILKIATPNKKNPAERGSRTKEEHNNIYQLELSDYRDILEEVAAYAEFSIEYAFREKNG